jgi:hypothetical protein
VATTPVIVAFGCEFRDYAHRTDLEQWLTKLAGAPKTPNRWTYKRGANIFDVKIVFTRAEFIAALNTTRAIVIYDGHARRGQGPVFTATAGMGDCPPVASFPTNPWEEHVRIGYDAVAIPCIEDIMLHCINPTEYSHSLPAKGHFVSPAVARMLKRAQKAGSACGTVGAKRSFAACHPAVANRANGRGAQTLLKRHFWRADAGFKEFHTIVAAGSADLAATKLPCSVLFLNSCSSAVHYLSSLQRRKKATGSDCVFYLTWRTAYMANSRATNIFMEELLVRGTNPRKRDGRKRLLKLMNGPTNATRDQAGHIDFFR